MYRFGAQGLRQMFSWIPSPGLQVKTKRPEEQGTYKGADDSDVVLQLLLSLSHEQRR